MARPGVIVSGKAHPHDPHDSVGELCTITPLLALATTESSTLSVPRKSFNYLFPGSGDFALKRVSAI